MTDMNYELPGCFLFDVERLDHDPRQDIVPEEQSAEWEEAFHKSTPSSSETAL
jgi:hypothetical protein